MNSVLEVAEFVTLMGSSFFLALILEWALLKGIFRALSAGLAPVAQPAPVRRSTPRVPGVKFTVS